MDKQILDSFVTTMTNLLQSAKTFTMEQVPLVCKEVVHYSIAADVVYMIIGLMLFVSAWLFSRLVNKLAKEEKDEGAYGMHMVSAIAVGIGSLFFVSNLLDLLKATLAPRMYLIEYFAHLIQK